MIGISFLEIVKGFWIIIKSLWWIWALALSIGLFPVIINWFSKWLEERRLKKWLEKHKTLEEWKKIDDREFERITAIIFQKSGYKTKVVGGPGDRGIDIIAQKDGKRTFFQCKQKEKVPPRKILEFSGALKLRKRKEGEKAFFVTTGNFTEEGRMIAKEDSIELIDGLKLEKLAKP